MQLEIRTKEDGVLGISVWRELVGVDRRTVVTNVRIDEEADAVVLSVRLRRSVRLRCGVCSAPSGRYDHGQGVRRWRALDLGTKVAHLEAEAPRVRCKEHGVVVAQVPWARHDSRFTLAFEDQCAWL